MHRITSFATGLVLAAAQAGAAPVDDARMLYLQGQCEPAVAILLPLAEAGDADAQNILGRAYDDGCGVDIDPDQALAWWTRSAGQGFASATYNLGEFWEYGRQGHDPDPARAADLYRQAAAQDHPDALAALGRMLVDGAGIPADPVQGAALVERAYGLGSIDAAADLARFLRDGLGLPKDQDRALALFREAAFYSVPAAVRGLGEMYQAGHGTPSDPVAAFALYHHSLGLGDEPSALNLAYLVTFADAYFRNPVYGHALCLWYIEGATGDDRAHREALCAEVRDALNPDELIAAKALYSTW